MAGWLYRNLCQKVNGFVVADPRRDKLISSDGDRRVELKHWIGLYHDRIRDAVRNINKIRARCRMHGVAIAFRDDYERMPSKQLF